MQTLSLILASPIRYSERRAVCARADAAVIPNFNAGGHQSWSTDNDLSTVRRVTSNPWVGHCKVAIENAASIETDNLIDVVVDAEFVQSLTEYFLFLFMYHC